MLSASRDKTRFEELHVGIEKCVNHLVTMEQLKMSVAPQYTADMEAVVAKVRQDRGLLPLSRPRHESVGHRFVVVAHGPRS